MIYHKGATQLDQCAHRLMEFNLSPDWHGSTVVGDYIAYYHEEKLYTVRHLKKGISCLVYARSPYDAIEKVRAMEGPRWIPVTERLPEAHKEVYVTDGEYIERANLLDEVFPGDQPCWSYSGLGEITHWCEKISLPEPPKEK